MKIMIILSCLFSGSVLAGTVKDVKFKKLKGARARVEIFMEGTAKGVPILKASGRRIELEIPAPLSVQKGSVKKISLDARFDTSLNVGRLSPKSTRVSLVFPRIVSGLKEGTSVEVKGKRMVLHFPFPAKKIAPPTKAIGRYKKKLKASNKVIGQSGKGKEAFDESFLQKLLDDRRDKKRERQGDAKKEQNPHSPGDRDTVRTKVSSPDQKGAGFPFLLQMGKFIGLLILVICIFYGTVLVLKKSIFSKGKLGFLNSTAAVEVLNTTHLAPKRSVMLVRAHKQIFLIGSSEKGLHTLGELDDMTGLLKKGEKELGGSNFDTSIEEAAKKDKEFNLKGMLESELPPVPPPTDRAVSQEREAPKGVKDRVRLSDEIKSRVRELKALS